MKQSPNSDNPAARHETAESFDLRSESSIAYGALPEVEPGSSETSPENLAFCLISHVPQVLEKVGAALLERVRGSGFKSIQILQEFVGLTPEQREEIVADTMLGVYADSKQDWTEFQKSFEAKWKQALADFVSSWMLSVAGFRELHQGSGLPLRLTLIDLPETDPRYKLRQDDAQARKALDNALYVNAGAVWVQSPTRFHRFLQQLVGEKWGTRVRALVAPLFGKQHLVRATADGAAAYRADLLNRIVTAVERGKDAISIRNGIQCDGIKRHMSNDPSVLNIALIGSYHSGVCAAFGKVAEAETMVTLPGNAAQVYERHPAQSMHSQFVPTLELKMVSGRSPTNADYNDGLLSLLLVHALMTVDAAEPAKPLDYVSANFIASCLLESALREQKDRLLETAFARLSQRPFSKEASMIAVLAEPLFGWVRAHPLAQNIRTALTADPTV